jgi:hypothetical protein
LRTITNHLVKVVSVLVLSVSAALISCSKDYNAFIVEKDAQLRQGYVWQKLSECRPPKTGSQSFPIFTNGGKRVVCFTLTPPEKQQITPSQTPQQNIKTDDSPNLLQPPTIHNKAKSNGVIWEFTNF